MTKIYRGTSNEWTDEFVRANRPKTFTATGGGEFGVGCYFWLDDLPAAIMSAIQYNANERDWGVVMVEFADDALHALAQRGQGYGSRVLEFKHDRESPFHGMGSKPGDIVVPKDYSHIASDPLLQANQVPAKPGSPPPRTFGKMQSSDFRAINADPVKYGLEGNKNEDRIFKRSSSFPMAPRTRPSTPPRRSLKVAQDLLSFESAAENRPSWAPAAGYPWSPARCDRFRELSDAADPRGQWPVSPGRRVA